MKSFEDGELFVYINGDKAEIGKVKRKNNTGDGYFCYYHDGETAANTPLECMYKIVNSYTIKATTLGGARQYSRIRYGGKMNFEITDELAELVDEHRHYRTEATARHLAAYICEELDKEEGK